MLQNLSQMQEELVYSGNEKEVWFLNNFVEKELRT